MKTIYHDQLNGLQLKILNRALPFRLRGRERGRELGDKGALCAYIFI